MYRYVFCIGEKIIMPVPSTQEIRKPLLEAFSDEVPHSFQVNDFLEIMADSLGENLDEMSSVDKNIFRNNINEAKIYLKSHGFMSFPSKGTYMITPKGSKALESDFDFMNDEKLIENLKEKNEIEMSAPVTSVVAEEPEIVEEISEEPETEFQDEISEDFSDKEFDEAVEEPVDVEPEEPEEEVEEVVEEVEELPVQESEPETEEATEEDEYLEDEPEQEDDYSDESSQDINEAFARYNSELADKVLDLVSKIPSDKFERLVIDLLSKMGYFAFQTSRYNAKDSKGSELIHGVIIDHENPGATPIYIQARKSSPEKIISRSDMQDFTKVLIEKGGRGIFATSASFSEQAAVIAGNERVILIDGKKLASLMVSNNFCVNVEKVFEVKAIDLDSFNEYED